MQLAKSGVNAAHALSGKTALQSKHVHPDDNVLSSVDDATLPLDYASSIQATGLSSCTWDNTEIHSSPNALVARMQLAKSGGNAAHALSGKTALQSKHVHPDDNVLSSVDDATLPLDYASSIQATCLSSCAWDNTEIHSSPDALIARMQLAKSGVNAAHTLSGKTAWQSKHVHHEDNVLSAVDDATLPLDYASSIQATGFPLG